MTMKYDHPEIIDPALDVIAAHDHGLYQEMKNSKWNITVYQHVDDPGISTEELSALENPGMAPEMATYDDTGDTDVFLWNNTMAARLSGLPLSVITAINLVHEYAHHKYHADEPAAYQAGIRFAEKIPGTGGVVANMRQMAEVPSWLYE